MSKENPVVFISYAHEGDLPERVDALAKWLRNKGVEVITDYPYADRPPEKGWPTWMQHSIEKADMVLIVCTERYKQLFERRNDEIKGGYGVTWESAIITTDVYESRFDNSRFYPVLPDNGSHEDVPKILKAWHNNHRFPSGNDRILNLITEEVTVPTPTKPFQQKRKGELSANDSRLAPREGFVLGREHEIQQVVDFLNSQADSSAVYGHVTGNAGIGKTEVCKAALKEWLSSSPSGRCFWVQVSDESDPQRFLNQLADALGQDSEQFLIHYNQGQLGALLPEGLYYLDNLESLAETTEGRDLLRALKQVPQLRILASSRKDLESLFGNSIQIEHLPDESALKLFKYCWNGQTLPNDDELTDFIKQQLGNHALSITLIARLGKYYDLEKIKTLWQQKGTEIAQSTEPDDRLESLNISFGLTFDLLKKTPGACALWQFIALFDEGIDATTLEEWNALEGNTPAERVLIDHHLLKKDEQGRYQMLPPIARYARSSEHGFDWVGNRELIYGYFIQLSEHASKIASTPENIQSKQRSRKQLWAMVNCLELDQNEPAFDLISRLHNQLYNVHFFNVLASQAWLQQTRQLLQDGDSSKKLADLEQRLGQLDKSRNLYHEAISLFETVQSQLGQANAIRALADLEHELGQVDKARNLYHEAIILYEIVQNQVGRANAIKSLADLECWLDRFDEARNLYHEAISLFETVKDLLGLANVIKSLAHMERDLGQVDKARDLYVEAIGLYETVHDQLGQANVYRGLGDLEQGLEKFQHAIAYYEKAIQLYHDEQVPMALADALSEILFCRSRLEKLDDAALLELLMPALVAAEKSGTESVMQYVLRKLFKACDEDEQRMRSILEKLKGKE